MSSKAIRAINIMITNLDKITDVIRNEDEYFFLYDKKHKWSISELGGEEIYLHYYTGPEDLKLIASFEHLDWQHYKTFVTYSTEELKTREAIESMKELYRLVKEKCFGVDKAFDDIISSDESF